MALVINTNNSSIAAQKNLFWTQDNQATTFKRLATGLRVNSAKDDAAGLYLITSQTTDIIGLNQATKNAGDGIALAQTAEGAMNQIIKNLQRVNELAIQSANGTYDAAARKAMNDESIELFREANRIVHTTEFNGLKLLNSAAKEVVLQVGFKSTDMNQIKAGITGGLAAIANVTDVVKIIASGVWAGGVGVLSAAIHARVNLQTSTNAITSISRIRAAITALTAFRAELGGKQNRFEAVISNNLSYNENLQAARSRIQDTDYAVETANLARLQVLQQAGMAVLSQSNAAQQNILGLLR